MKLIIDIPDKVYEGVKALIAINFGGRFFGKGLAHDSLRAIKNGVPLDFVKAEIKDKAVKNKSGDGFIFLDRLEKIFANIGKEESEDKA